MGEQPPRIDRPRQRDLARPDRREAEAPVIGHVADEQHEGEAFRLRAAKPLLDERPAEALALLCGIHHERAEQQRILLLSDADGSEADAPHETILAPADEAQGGNGRDAFPHAISASGEAAWAEGLCRELRERWCVAVSFEADMEA